MLTSVQEGVFRLDSIFWPCLRCAVPPSRTPLPFSWGIAVMSQRPDHFGGSSFVPAVGVVRSEGAV